MLTLRTRDVLIRVTRRERGSTVQENVALTRARLLARSKNVASERTSWSPPRLRGFLRNCAAFLVATACVLVRAPASAEEVERIAVSYEAHPLCPNEDAFVGEISARTSKFQRAPEREASRALRVKLSEEPGHAMTRGELVLADGEVRVVHDEKCAVVVSGLALIAALAIDPEAETGETIDRTPSPPAPLPPPPPATPLPLAPVEIARRDHAIIVGALAGVGARVGLVPISAAAMIAGFVGLEGGGLPTWLHLQVRLQLAGAGPRRESGARPGPAAKLQWYRGHLEGCGALGRGRLRLGPCALFEVGAVHAVGVDVNYAQSTTRVGGSVGPGLRAMLSAGHLYGDIGAFALIPLRRDRFYVDPSVTLFRSSAVGGELGANVGVKF